MKGALITAGATRNPVDAIRYLSAGATGTTGIAIASAIGAHFATHLLGSEEAILRARLALPQLSTEVYGSTRDLMARMEEWLRGQPGGVLVHSAAVGDYECDRVATKIPSGQPEIVLRLHPGPKIIDHVRDWCPDVVLVSFKAGSPEWSDERLEAVARAQLVRTGSNLVFANRLGELGTSCMILDASGSTRFTRRDDAVASLVGRLLAVA